MSMKFKFHTLGCKVNQYETQAMEALLRQRGHEPTEGEADAVIINTCAVTAESSRKSRQAVRRLRAENPNSVIAVCGCYSQISPEEASGLEADIVYGSGQRNELLDALELAVAARDTEQADAQCVSIDDPFQRRLFEELPAGSVSGRTRAMLKIEDGCDNFCTYCVIPYARGRVRSLPPERAAAQAAALESQGYRELVITGIEISSYGKDLKRDGCRLYLTDVIESISKAAPGTRLRLGSLEPTIVTEEFCTRLSALGNVCPHFHLSLQSGCDKTLANMHRKYDSAAFYNAVVRLRDAFPGCALTADMITGFPGETEEDHAEALRFIRKCGFSDMHIFPYSERPGTPAASMEGRILHRVRSDRAHQAQQLADEMKREYLHSCIGKTLSVLFETEENGISYGHSGNYCLVGAEGTGLRGLVENVKITGVSGENLVGLLV